MYKLTLVFILMLASSSLTVAADAQSASGHGSTQEGHRLALSKCDVCHVVASDQQYQPLLSHYAPSFSDISNRPNTTTQSLEAFLAHHHSFEKMPFPDLTPTQASDLVSYIISLRGRR